VKYALNFTGQSQRLIRLTASGIFDRRISQKEQLSISLDIPDEETYFYVLIELKLD
jgi:hypothetical protein